MKKSILIIVLLLLFGITTKEQITGINLVNNPSFEEYDSCPNNGNQMAKCKYWWGFSTEYYNACANYNTGVSVPSNLAGFQYANTGNAYAGFVIYSNSESNYDYREAIKTKLKSTLVADKRYCNQLYVTLAEFQSYFSTSFSFLDSIGMLFTIYSVPDVDNAFYIGNNIKILNSIYNIDTVSWFKMSNSFIAKGGEQYLTIGNFDNVINYPSGGIGMAYVYVDDVSVCECSFKFSLSNDTTLCNGEILQLNVSMPNATYTWQDGSHDSTYTVTHAGTYYVSAYFADYNITTYDTINIMYKDCEDTLVIPNIFTPNGDNYNDYFVIKNSNNWNINLQVFNRWGNEVYKADNYQNNWDGKYKGNPLSDGTYFYIIKAKGKDSGKEKEYKGSLMIMR